ncbi:protein CTLA-2-alpha-like [Drosophila miranda]|uniref:protein CTLA-2-alpha-like n=1 Tax=Drosophila miranda TaxID=7229 RepID=UPI00143F2E52|nr:protein CTLA-2-alpha-like [Drosophila miranda]
MSLVADEEWAEYIAKFNKSYEAAEDLLRRDLYEKAKAKVVERNRKYDSGEVTWKMAINHLSDDTEEEFAKRCGKRTPPK